MKKVKVIHFYNKPMNVLTVLCGEFEHCVKHTSYKNRVTCSLCLKILEKPWQINQKHSRI